MVTNKIAKKNAAFRCDASPAIGTGHVMRCLTLADAMTAKGWVCSFMVSDDTIQTTPFLQETKHQILSIYDTPKNTDLLIVDHYGLGREYETSARRWANKIMVIDDLADRSHDCDILMDQTFGRNPEDYRSLVPKHAEILAGSEYALLRPQFSEMREEALKRREARQGKIERILITLGGTNINNITGRVLETFNHFHHKAFEIDVVLGGAASDFDAVQKSINKINHETAHNITQHAHVNNMARLMTDADLCIGAGGTTTWERCCLGLPTVMIELADNQHYIAKNLHNIGAVLNIGWHEDITELDIAKALEVFCLKPERVYKVSRSALHICDGLGCLKTVNRTAGLLRHNLILREAVIEDATNLLEWRNHPSTRRASFDSKPINYSEHMKWLHEKLADEKCVIYIAEHNGHAVGMVRAEEIKDEYELSWVIAPDKRGQGHGKHMLKAILTKLDKQAYAKIRQDNEASLKMAESSGMYYCQENENFLIYKSG